MAYKWIGLALCAMTLIGCAVRSPAPVIDKSRQSGQAYVVSENPCKADQPGEFCHVVEKGDTLYAISRKYGAKVVEIASRNGIQAPYIIKPGQRLIVRPQDAVAVSQITSSSKQQTRRVTTKSAPVKPTPSTNQVATKAPAKPSSSSKSSVSRPKPSTSTKAVKLVPIKSNPHPGWHWPVAYRPLPPSGPNTAWDYMLDEGVEIVAATSGKVIYAGAGLNKFKHLVIVDSGARYLLAYEFNSGHSMREGQQLSAGQLITKIERPSGLQVDSQERYKQFHFEIWANGKPVNPNSVLGVVARN